MLEEENTFGADYEYAGETAAPEDAGTEQSAPYSPYGQNPYFTAPEEPKKKKKRGKAGRVIALVLVCALLGGLSGFGGSLLADRLFPKEPEVQEKISQIYEGKRETVSLESVQTDTGRLMTPAEVYAANVNSTVGIRTETTTNFWGYQTTAAASGSGFIITADGYVLTNYHVVEDADSITVSTYDGRDLEAALIGYDASNDVAVLKIEGEGLTPVILGDSSQLRIGDYVVAIGNPLGELTFSLTQGVVSALDREVTFSNDLTMSLIQTDCAINAGNSGGALFNLYGEVIGISNGKRSGTASNGASIDGICFAIPLNSVRTIVESIIEKGYISRPYIGVTVGTVSAEAQRYGLPAGAAITKVLEDGPAAAGGMQENDIVTAIDGNTVENANDLIDYVSGCEIGAQIELTVYRQSGEVTLTVTVGETVRSALEAEEKEEEPAQQQPSSGGFGGGIGGFDWSDIFGFPFGF